MPPKRTSLNARKIGGIVQSLNNSQVEYFKMKSIYHDQQISPRLQEKLTNILRQNTKLLFCKIIYPANNRNGGAPPAKAGVSNWQRIVWSFDEIISRNVGLHSSVRFKKTKVVLNSEAEEIQDHGLLGKRKTFDFDEIPPNKISKLDN